MKTEVHEFEPEVEHFHYVAADGSMYAPPEFSPRKGFGEYWEIVHKSNEAVAEYVKAGLPIENVHVYITCRVDRRKSVLVLNGPAALVFGPMPKREFA